MTSKATIDSLMTLHCLRRQKRKVSFTIRVRTLNKTTYLAMAGLKKSPGHNNGGFTCHFCSPLFTRVVKTSNCHRSNVPQNSGLGCKTGRRGDVWTGFKHDFGGVVEIYRVKEYHSVQKVCKNGIL